MKSITKNRVVLSFVLVVLVFAIYNVEQYQSSNVVRSNSLEMENERKILDEIEPKTSGDNSYKKVWDSGTAFSSSIESVCTGDQDSDGKKEIIFGYTAEFDVLEYNSTYTNYTVVWSDWLGSSVTTVCTGDQDGDGKGEIIGGGKGYSLYIYEYNDTDNDYAKVYDEWLGESMPVWDISIGDDVDKDGNQEIIVAVEYYVYVYEYNFTDNGCYRTWEYDFGAPNYAYSACGSNDLDGDGKKEIISDGSDRIHVFESTANNTYTDVWDSGNIIGADTMSLWSGDDLDGDGKKEIVAGSLNNKIYVFEFNGTDDGYNKTWDSGTDIGDIVNSVSSGEDLDGDGKKEIIAASDDNKVYVFEFNGTDNGYDKVWDSGAIIGGDVTSVCYGDDLDGNGKKEIIAGSENGKVYIFEHRDSIPSQVIFLEEDDDDDDDDDEEGIYISTTTLIIGGTITAIAIAGIILLLIKRKR